MKGQRMPVPDVERTGLRPYYRFPHAHAHAHAHVHTHVHTHAYVHVHAHAHACNLVIESRFVQRIPNTAKCVQLGILAMF